MNTSQSLMGGEGLTRKEAESIAAFIDYSRSVDVPNRNSQSDSVLRGKRIFERGDVACARCHGGPLYSDGNKYSMFGIVGVKTPSLLGVAATPPYLHDGSAATLGDLLERVRDGSMGNTSSLSDSEMEDLQAYLLSL